MTTLHFQAFRDDDAGVWVATSNARMTAEALSKDEVLARLKAMVPDVLESHGIAPHARRRVRC